MYPIQAHAFLFNKQTKYFCVWNSNIVLQNLSHFTVIVPEFAKLFTFLFRMHFKIIGDPAEWISEKVGEVVERRRKMKEVFSFKNRISSFKARVLPVDISQAKR